MAEDNLVQYDLTSSYYACRECGTHIALSSDCDEHHFSWYISVKNPINLKIATPQDYSHSRHLTTANASCSGCNKLLGKKIILATIPFDSLEEGHIVILTKKLLFWDGNQMQDEITKLLNENPPGQ